MNSGTAMAELSLQVNDLDEAGRDYSFSLSTSWLDEHLGDAGMRHDPDAGEGQLELHAQQNGPAEYLVNGQLDAGLLTDCVRCLGPAKVPVHTAIAVLFKRGAASHARKVEVELDDDELQEEPFSGHEIVLDDLVREHLVLECPMQPLCSPDCEGIPVPEHVRPPEEVFGTGTTGKGQVDPRLAPLMRLRDKVPPKSDADPKRSKQSSKKE
jgi:uncharacterized protein